jgi:ring-1,2-phenylacetyl-CoA epoxidase subunit PaaE
VSRATSSRATSSRARPAGVPRRRSSFHPLAVAGVQRLTEDAVVLTFEVPESLREAYAFRAGQHITIRRVESGVDVRRSYSLCSTPAELAARGTLRIGVKFIEGGTFSRYVATQLRPGDPIDVLPPLGHFTSGFAAERVRHYAAIAAGSGITPVLSLMATALSVEPASRFSLLYGNRSAVTVMFADDLADLKDRYPSRVHLVHAMSREEQLSPLLSGRLDADRLRAILGARLVDPTTVDEWFLCGPYGMVEDAKGVLADYTRAGTAVHTELFHVDGGAGSAPAAPSAVGGNGAERTVTATVVLDGRVSTVGMTRTERVLDAALRVRPELPYACRGGVCSTCRARLVEGEVVMAQNYALEPADLAAGYVLTCQSSPVTDTITVDYDA